MENELFSCGDVVIFDGKLYEVVDEMYLLWYIEHMPIVYILNDGLSLKERYALPHTLQLASEKETEMWRLLYGKVSDKYRVGSK